MNEIPSAHWPYVSIREYYDDESARRKHQRIIEWLSKNLGDRGEVWDTTEDLVLIDKDTYPNITIGYRVWYYFRLPEHQTLFELSNE